jgi:hypothetical protein
MTARCLTCGQPVLNTLTPGHKKMTLDAEPTPYGTIEVRGGYAIALSAAQVAEAHRAGRRLYHVHAANCHDFARWRQRS